jgi:hypothetical protein
VQASLKLSDPAIYALPHFVLIFIPCSTGTKDFGAMQNHTCVIQSVIIDDDIPNEVHLTSGSAKYSDAGIYFNSILSVQDCILILPLLSVMYTSQSTRSRNWNNLSGSIQISIS